MKKLALATSLLASLNVHAALYDRGNGMIYDDALDITWLQDANYAHTTGYSDVFGSDGQMQATAAKTWASNLSYRGITGWRLASANLYNTPLTPFGTIQSSFDGSTDYAFNNTRSELGHLFAELGNRAQYDSFGILQADFGFKTATFIDAGSGKLSSFVNVKKDSYWELEQGTANAFGRGWQFDMYYGYQSTETDWFSNYAWAVHDGDVAAVPAPATGWLFGSGLVGLVATARRRKLN